MALAKIYGSFLYRVGKRTRPTVSGCFEFYGSLNQDGYGRIPVNKKLVFVHRELWRQIKGEIPAGMCVCHHCDNPCCVNLQHMFLGTHQDNMADRKRKKRYSVKYGDDNPVSKLKESDIPVIRERIKNGHECYQIGREYGVTGEAILAIKHGRTWKHVC